LFLLIDKVLEKERKKKLNLKMEDLNIENYVMKLEQSQELNKTNSEKETTSIQEFSICAVVYKLLGFIVINHHH